MKIERFIFGPFETNCYVVSDEQHVLLIDPACAYEWEQQELLRYVEKLKANSQQPIAILATHGHLDHLWGAAWASETWHTPVLMHPDDIPMAKAMQQQYDLFGVRSKPQPIKGTIISNFLSFRNDCFKFQMCRFYRHRVIHRARYVYIFRTKRPSFTEIHCFKWAMAAPTCRSVT